jgi:hypothetical protein
MAAVLQTPSFVCENGELFIATPQLLRRFRWQPAPMAESRVPGQKKWALYWPSMRLIQPVGTPSTQDLSAKNVAFQAFRRELPAELAELAAPFESHQWQLLKLMHSSSSAIDLAKANPVLAYCLANNSEFRGTKPEVAAEQAIWYSHRKQKVILGWLGFPASESIVRLFRKITQASVYPSLMRRLKGVLSGENELQSVLAHLPSISQGVLELVSTPELAVLVTPKLLIEVGGSDDEAIAGQMAEVIHGGLMMLNELNIKATVRPFSSIAQVMRFQDRVDAEYLAILARKKRLRLAGKRYAAEVKRGRNEQKHGYFPTPPIEGTSAIIPLTSAKSLAAEGVEQHNCVGGYGRRVLTGSLYVYTVLSPERATLSIVRRPDGCWCRSELKLQSNKAVSMATVNAVEQWLAQYRVSV